jgi:hypothetical protein
MPYVILYRLCGQIVYNCYYAETLRDASAAYRAALEKWSEVVIRCYPSEGI